MSDPWLLAAIAWVESGFRSDAVEDHGRGPGIGLFQLHRAYHDAKCSADVRCAVAEAAGTLSEMRSYHRRRCGDLKPHDWLAHWFGGRRVESNERAVTSAAKVRARRAVLWELAYEVD